MKPQQLVVQLFCDTVASQHSHGKVVSYTDPSLFSLAETVWRPKSKKVVSSARIPDGSSEIAVFTQKNVVTV